MTLANVLAKTTITGFTNAEKATITGVITTSYNGSATAKAMYESFIATGKVIDIKKVAGVFQAYGNTGRVEIDFAELTNAAYINPTGKGVKDTALTAIVHELGHALTGRRDTISTADYAGPNVKFVNTIYQELGLDKQISYTGYSSTGDIKVNFNYTNGAAIDVAIAGYASLDTGVNPTATKDLFIGTNAANVFKAGAGADFFVGRGGNDDMSGGTGTDSVFYFGNNLDYDVRLNPDGTWTVRHARGVKDAGTDTLRNIEKIRFETGGEFDLKKKGLTFQTDFALVIDTTGSMGDDIDGVKAAGSRLIDAAFKNGKGDGRIGIVTFKDDTIGEATQVLLRFTDQDSFAARKAAALAALNGIGVGGGGDLPETAFSGLLAALDGRMGDWRPGAGVLRIALFTDAAAKDGALAAQVSAFASKLGATISARSTLTGSSGAVDTFELKFDADRDGRNTEGNVLPFVDTGPEAIEPFGEPTAQIQIFTILTGPGGVDTAALDDIAEANGGDLLTAPTPDDLVDTLFDIINLPTTSPPVVSAPKPDVSASEGAAVTIDAKTAFTDPDSPILTFTAKLADGSALPDWLTLTNGVLTGTVPVGTEDVTVRVTATDPGGLSATDEFSILVAPAALLPGAGPRNNVLRGTGGDDIGSLGAGRDVFLARNGDDQIAGGTGNDLILGEGGDDSLFGQAGDDQLFGGAGNDALSGGVGNDVLGGGEGNDSLNGGDGNDVLAGGSHTDTLRGGGGNDLLRGDGGADRLEGGAGNDLLFGGGSGDTLVFSGLVGVDRVYGFEDGADRIELNGYGALSFTDDILPNLSQRGANVFLQSADIGTIIIVNTKLAQIGSGDFLFT